MKAKLFIAFVFCLAACGNLLGQRPPGRPGPQGPPRGDERPGGQHPPKPPNGEWMRPHDANNNGTLEANEFQSAMDRSFAEFDTNSNGTIEPGEMRKPPRHGDRPRPMVNGAAPGSDGKRILPPFFFLDRVGDDVSVSKAEFETIVRGVFAEMDGNKDGVLTPIEARRLPPRGDKPPHNRPGMAPNAKFIAAELRFGDKLIKGQPFSAETVIEDTRRLFDGTTVTKQSRGAIYRDAEGRTRREQPLEMVGGVSVVGTDNKPQMLVFINDFATDSQIFLDLNNKVARRSRIGRGPGPREPGEPSDAKIESLGTKTIEGVKVEGTRVSFAIPVGHIGNDKPIDVVTEKWFSTELQVLVMSRHLDPIAGEHIFKLVNIKRSEPSAEMFAVPAGFRTEGPPER